MTQGMNTTQKRLRILGDDEIEAVYRRPRFTHEERLEYFSLSPTEKAALEQLHSIKSRIYFILQLGYFKARQPSQFRSDLYQTISNATFMHQTLMDRNLKPKFTRLMLVILPNTSGSKKALSPIL